MKSGISSKQCRDSDSPTGSILDSNGERSYAKQQRRPKIQKEQTNLIDWMEDCQRVLYIQEHGISSRKESQSRKKHGMIRHVFRSNTNHWKLSSRVNLKRSMTINKWRSKCNLSSVVSVCRAIVKRELVDASPQFNGG